MQTTNMLYYGDNLDVMRRYIRDEVVDLVYLDPPFNSNANYNVLFAERDGTKAAGQMKAFEDTWEWDDSAYAIYTEMVERGGELSNTLQAFHMVLSDTNMMAYLAMMAPRLVELHRVLSPTGSIYLHCDPTASHYLKILMDAIFGPQYFRNEITWKRSSAHSDIKQGRKAYGNIADTILYYTKSEEYTFNAQYTPYSKEYIKSTYNNVDPDGRLWKSSDLTGPGGASKGNPYFEFMGVSRYWRFTKENLEKLKSEGRIHQSKPGTVPRMKHYLDEMPGIPLQNIWDDISPISAQAAERMGYPTQKPQALLDRIVNASSNPGDVVLDPFCGCGTAVVAAQKLGRSWIGIDITHVAINLIKKRLKDSFNGQAEFKVIGEPTTVHDAEELAKNDPYQFQWWALGLVGARLAEGKKGADQGIDGRLFFHDDETGKTKSVILSVKAGNLHANYVRDLRGVIEREKAAIGVVISFKEPTKPMRSEAAEAGYYQSPLGSRHPRLQLLTISELLNGAKIDMPRGRLEVTYKKAPKQKKDSAMQLGFLDEE